MPTKIDAGHKNSFYGKTHSDETKKAISEKRKGVKPANRRKVIADGVIYDSVTDCAKAYKISAALVLYRIKSNKYEYSYEMPNDYPVVGVRPSGRKCKGPEKVVI